MIIVLRNKNVSTYIERSTILLMQSDHNKHRDHILTAGAPIQNLPHGTVEKVLAAIAPFPVDSKEVVIVDVGDVVIIS